MKRETRDTNGVPYRASLLWQTGILVGAAGCAIRLYQWYQQDHVELSALTLPLGMFLLLLVHLLAPRQQLLHGLAWGIFLALVVSDLIVSLVSH